MILHLTPEAAVGAPIFVQPQRGYAKLYAEHVLQADQGCDFDFLRAGGA